jgi:hypothetical protein
MVVRMRKLVVSRATIITAALSMGLQLSYGCAEGASPVGDGITDGGGTGPKVTFTQVWNEVIVPKGCNGSVCHGATPPMGELSFASQATAYFNLVNAPAAGPSCSSSGLLRVSAGDPDQSLLLQKMSNATPTCGTTMPPTASVGASCTTQTPTSCNTDADIQLVRNWIAGGAMND